MKPCWYRLLLTACLLLLTSCVATPEIKDLTLLDPRQERDTLYIVPFDATLVPSEVGDLILNEFVDILNARRKLTKVGRFAILKEELKEVDPSWLIKQVYISGDVWGYVEKTGCCSTEMKVKAKIHLTEPGKNSPAFEVFVPGGYYFDHDRGDIGTAKERLGKKLALDLAETVIRKLTP